MGKLSDLLKAFIEKFKFAEDYHSREEDRLIRGRHFEEEVSEYYDAVLNNDEISQIDALCDIAYFAIGTMVLEGWDFEEHFKAVHRANMEKVRGANPNRPENGDFDVFKPEGWVAPEEYHEAILKAKAVNSIKIR